MAAPSKQENFNKALSDVFEQMAAAEKSRGDAHRAHAYAKAAGSLRRHPKRIESGAEARAELAGVGVKIAAKIDEILATGRLRQLEETRADKQLEAIKLLSRVPGIGPVTARQLVEERGVRSLADLRQIGATLTRHQQIGLRYFEELELRVPRAEVAIFAALVAAEAQAEDPLFRVDLVGSFRRGLPESGDVDLLLTHPDFTVKKKAAGPSVILERLAGRLLAAGVLTDVIAQGEAQVMGVCRLPAAQGGGAAGPHRRIDIKLVPAESHACALLHYTGSGEFNRLMRVEAQKRHLKLSEYALRPVEPGGQEGAPLPVLREADVFEALGMPYREPEQRNV